MCHKHRPWWLLLLLLPFLLFIRCQKDITVCCIEQQTEVGVGDLPVKLSYQAYYLWKDRRFFAVDSVAVTENTDSVGKAVFRGLPCSVYSYLFCCLENVLFNAADSCHEPLNSVCNFHYAFHRNLWMEVRREDLQVRVEDLETKDVLPDAWIHFSYVDGGTELQDSVQTDAAGVVIMKNMPVCSAIKSMKGSCYGYADTTVSFVPCSSLLVPGDSSAVKLRPVKDRFRFYVKNKETREPIPDAVAEITLARQYGKSKPILRNVHTSVDGKGVAICEDAFVLSMVSIKASKHHYRDGQLENAPWVVEKLLEQPDDIRTIWLLPEPYVVEFMNVDSITGKPVAGVRNTIRVTDPNGTVSTVVEMSNSHGVFPIKAKENSEIEIIADKSPSYYIKHQKIPAFKGKEVVRMRPHIETLVFRTIREENGALLPHCKLAIHGSSSGSLTPHDSGDGEFKVTMQVDERLTIIASHTGYRTNDYTVRNADFQRLSTYAANRDIPLKMDLPPCQGGVNVPKANNEMHHCRSYSMGQQEGDAEFVCDFYSQYDYLTIYDGTDTTGRVLTNGGVPRMMIANKHVIPFHFTQAAVTVVIETFNGNSSWEYVVKCPH